MSYVRQVLQPPDAWSDCGPRQGAYHDGSRTDKETIMPSNQEYKGKGMKGRNYDELSGVGTSSAGKTGTTGNLNDGGVGTPDLGDAATA